MYRTDDIMAVSRISESDILDLFSATGISNPTEIQKNTVVSLLNRTIHDIEAFLQAGIETAAGLRRWRGLHDAMKTIDTVGDHHDRVAALISQCHYPIHVASDTFDFKKAGFMARHHDMTEGLSPFGDIPTPLKQALPPKLKMLFKKVEYACIEILAYKSDSDYQRAYSIIKDTLLEMEAKETQESQIVKYFDVFDAYMMSIHEYGLGTIEFLDRVEWYQTVFQSINRGEFLPFLQDIQHTSIKNCSIYMPNDPYSFQESPFLDTNTLATLPIDTNILKEGTSYKYWKKYIAKTL